MLESLAGFSPVTQALIATTFTYLLTAVGTLPVLFFKSAPRRLMDAMMGFAAGVMVAASCWSLLVPAIDRGGVLAASVGLLLGGAFLYVADQLLPHLHGEFPNEAKVEGPRVAWQRSALLMLAMTLHNVPEGMAVGVSFGGGDLAAATALAIGIGLQNVPEGLAIALPLRQGGMSRGRAFFWGQLSAVVEPAAGVIGEAMVLLTLADFVLEKFGGDSLAETRDNLERYRQRIAEPPDAPVAGGRRNGHMRSGPWPGHRRAPLVRPVSYRSVASRSSVQSAIWKGRRSRIAGGWRISGPQPARCHDRPIAGTFREVAPPGRLVFTWGSPGDADETMPLTGAPALLVNERTR